MHLLNEGTDDGQPTHGSGRTDSPEQYDNLLERDSHDDLAIPGEIELDGQDISETGAEQDTNQGRNPDARRDWIIGQLNSHKVAGLASTHRCSPKN